MAFIERFGTILERVSTMTASDPGFMDRQVALGLVDSVRDTWPRVLQTRIDTHLLYPGLGRERTFYRLCFDFLVLVRVLNGLLQRSGLGDLVLDLHGFRMPDHTPALAFVLVGRQ